jgi:hypothetical protein
MADYSNGKFEITFLAPHIFKLRAFEEVEMNEHDVIELRNKYLELSDNKPYAILLDAAQHFTQTNEARELLASEEFAKTRIAAAFVTNSLASKLIGNFFIQFNKPPTPTRLFNDYNAAFEWLKEHIDNYYRKANLQL